MADNHTQGKYEADLTTSESGPIIGIDGVVMIQMIHEHTGKRKTRLLTDRVRNMLNAADGMPTEQVVKFIEHGSEMVEFTSQCRYAGEGGLPELRGDAKILHEKLVK